MSRDSKQPMVIDGHRIDLTHQDKVYFPASGITKQDLCNYYQRIAPLALPYYRNRPLTQHRFPDGISHDGFFQKDLPDYFPDWIERMELEKKDGTTTYILANNAATLVYLANQGCITPHLALALGDNPHHPDRMIFDLDPSSGDFSRVQQAAAWTKNLLDELDIASYVQTTGSRGLHVVVPLDRRANFDTVRQCAIKLAKYLVKRHPQELTIEQRKAKRGERVFLDYLRNAYGQTAVAPYAVRPIEGAPVATPLRWDEAFASSLTPQRYHLRNLFRRLAQMDDPWKNMASDAVSIAAIGKIPNG